MAKRTTKEGAKVKHKFEMPRRISPLQDAICHVISRTDKTDKLEVKFINAVKGKVLSGMICWMTSTAADDVASHDSSPSLSVNPMDDAAGPSNTQQMTSTAADDVASHDSSPSLSVNPMDDAAGPSNTQQAMTVPQDTFEVFVPRLRRTRSVIMKDTVFEDSDELYCTTPESGEGFIPDTTSKSDTDREVFKG
ncbi:uncharacterized protein LOC113091576 [Scomber scombrus]|uniref:Uncharacterized protein LOC113091576 n=1 Tax=Scomber scombrus TaxID=13677 RepID=A0AAV1PFH3_SCOSC